MASLNRVELLGRLAADPQPIGETGCSIRVATNRSYTNKAGEKVDEATFSRVVCWNGLAKQCKQYLTKGRLVYVQARLTNRQVQDEAGETKYYDDIVAESIQFLDAPKTA